MNNRKKVLIIDDEVDLCVLLTNYLGRKNYDVFYSHSLKEGIVEFNKIVPDILFLDNNLPDGLGWEKVSYFLKSYPSLQLHLITAYHPEVPELGPNRYKVWEKPLTLKELDNYLS